MGAMYRQSNTSMKCSLATAYVLAAFVLIPAGVYDCLCMIEYTNIAGMYRFLLRISDLITRMQIGHRFPSVVMYLLACIINNVWCELWH